MHVSATFDLSPTSPSRYPSCELSPWLQPPSRCWCLASQRRPLFTCAERGLGLTGCVDGGDFFSLGDRSAALRGPPGAISIAATAAVVIRSRDLWKTRDIGSPSARGPR